MEVYHNGEWGTVCGDGWDLSDAQVVCNELGIGNSSAVRYDAFYGEGNGKILVSNSRCVETELSIKKCSHRGWGLENCSHSQDVGVKCVSGTYVIAYCKCHTYHNLKCCLQLRQKFLPFSSCAADTI